MKKAMDNSNRATGSEINFISILSCWCLLYALKRSPKDGRNRPIENLGSHGLHNSLSLSLSLSHTLSLSLSLFLFILTSFFILFSSLSLPHVFS